MSRRQSLDRPGILSPPGPFLTPSPSSSISASPRLQPSPSLSPFPQDVLLVTNNTITNTTQEQERKAATPSRRPSIHQLSGSPNAGSTVVFQPSPSQSPAATTVVGITGNEFNTTLVGSNNISLNKKTGNKRSSQSSYGGYHGSAITTSAALAAANLASSPKGTSKKATVLPMSMINASNSTITNDSPIASPNSGSTLRTSTPQPMLQQIPVVNAGNQLLQFIQGQQLIATANQQRSQMVTANQNQSSQITTSGTKTTRGPQQILPKPQQPLIHSTSEKTVITQTKAVTVQQSGQISQSPQQPTVVTTTTTQAQGGQIILPSGNLNTQPLLLNQMPVIVQQNTPQGVQLILRPPTPQLTAPSLVIHNTRPQLQQPQPQQLLRILNTNGAMQLAAPTFIVSSQANLIQQNLQTIKANTQTAPITQLSGLHAAAATPRSQQIAAAINSHIIGQSMAQLQNLQLNGNLAQIQMPNGLNGPIISQLPAQFQQSLAGFNQINQNINLNQLNSTNIQIAAAAAAAAGATFQSPPPSQVSELQMPSVMPAQNIQFSTNNHNQMNAATVQQQINMTSPAVTPQPQLIQSVTPEPVRNPTPVLQNVITSHQATTTVLVQPDNVLTMGGTTTVPSSQLPSNLMHTNVMNKMNFKQNDLVLDLPTTKPPPKKSKSRKKKIQPSPTPCPPATTSNSSITTSPASTTNTKNSNNKYQQQNVTSTGKLDLANVMKLCGIMEDDDYMDTEIDTSVQHQPQQHEEPKAIVNQQQHHQHIQTHNVVSSPASNNGSDIMITIPSQNSDIPFTFTIPTSQQCDTKPTQLGGNIQTCANPMTTLNTNSCVDTKSSNNINTTSNSNNNSNNTNVTNNLDAQNIVIKIDQNDSGQPYTISIPRMQHDDNSQQTLNNVQIMQQQQQQSQHHIQPMLQQHHYQNQQQCNTSVAVVQTSLPAQSITSRPIGSSGTSGSFNIIVSSSSSNNSNNMLPTFVNSIIGPTSSVINGNQTATTPTIQSQINEIQNQLMGVAAPVSGVSMTTSTISPHSIINSGPIFSQVNNTISSSSSSSSSLPFIANQSPAIMTTATSTIPVATSAVTPSLSTIANTTPATTAATTTTATVKPRRKPNKRNGKKIDTIPTSVGNVPSQIGNIQISQVDATKIANQNMPISNVVENKIQIMPILDNKIGQNNNNQQQQQQQQSQQQQHHQLLQHQQHSQQNINQVVFQSSVQHITQQQNQGSNINLQIDQSNLITRNNQTDNNSNSVHQQRNITIGSQQQQSLHQQQSSNVNSNNNNNTTSNGNHMAIPLAPQPSTSPVTAVFPQLTGSLSLAFADDGGRLLLRHDPNSPQDSQSQLILQAILNGALCNVTIINEPYDKNKAIKNNMSIGTNTTTTGNQNNIIHTATSQPTPIVGTLNNKSAIIQHPQTHSNISKNIGISNNQNTMQIPTTIQQANSFASSNVNVTSSHQSSIGNFQHDNSGNNVIASSAIQQKRLLEIRKNDSHNHHQQQQQQQQQQQHNQQQQHHQQLATQSAIINSNSPKLVSLPKVDANQQLFSLNTITNQITQINPMQTTAALGPMERLLIAPTGINAQQLAQCWSQGQIHLNNVGQVSQANEQQHQQSLSTNIASQRIQQQIVHPQQHQTLNSGNPQPLQQIHQTKQVANVAPIIDASKAKCETTKSTAKKSKPRKPKITHDNNLNKNLKTIQKVDLNVKSTMNPVQIVQPTTATSSLHKDHILNRSISTSGSSISTTTSSTNIHPFQTTQTGTKLIGVTAPMQQITQQRSQQCNNNIINPSNNNIIMPIVSQSSTSLTSNTTISLPQSSNSINHNNSNSAQLKTQSQIQQSLHHHQMPPLISVNATQPVPRVQTIQLTPQQQQLLKTVQIQIQQLSARLQNKSLLATLNIPPDFDPANPMYNKPLPSLNNIQNMSDTEIHAALQRLFIEQQKILASGKVIPTISTGTTHAFISSPLAATNQNQSQSISSIGNGSAGIIGTGNSTTATQEVSPMQINHTSNSSQIVFSSQSNQNKIISSSSSALASTSSSSSSTTSMSVNAIITASHSKNDGQPIPANIVQPNNHNNTTNSNVLNNSTTQRIHIYPMLHNKTQILQQQQQIKLQKEAQQQIQIVQQHQQQHQHQPQQQQQQQHQQQHQPQPQPQQQQQQPQPHQQQPHQQPQQSQQQQQQKHQQPQQNQQHQQILQPSSPTNSKQSTATATNPTNGGGELLVSPAITTPQQSTASTLSSTTPSSGTTAVTIKVENMIKVEPQEESSSQLSSTSYQSLLASPKSKMPRQMLFERFERQIEVDQESCTKPDYVVPFQSQHDAVKRLIRYHCMFQKDEETSSDEDEDFEKVAINLQEQFKAISSKFQYLLLEESMRTHRTSELRMIEELIVTDMRKELLEMRNEMNLTNNNSLFQQNNSIISKSINNINYNSSCKIIKKETDSLLQFHHQQQQQSQYQYLQQQSNNLMQQQVQLQQQQQQHPHNSQNIIQQQYQHSINNLNNNQLQGNMRILNKIPVDNNLVKSEIKSEPCDLMFDKCDNTNVNSNTNVNVVNNNNNNIKLNNINNSNHNCNNSNNNIRTTPLINDINSIGISLSSSYTQNSSKIFNNNNELLHNSIIKDEKNDIICNNIEIPRSVQATTTMQSLSSSSLTAAINNYVADSNYMHKNDNTIKREIENFEIDTEINPRFISKKIETSSNVGLSSLSSSSGSSSLSSTSSSNNNHNNMGTTAAGIGGGTTANLSPITPLSQQSTTTRTSTNIDDVTNNEFPIDYFVNSTAHDHQSPSSSFSSSLASFSDHLVDVQKKKSHIQRDDVVNRDRNHDENDDEGDLTHKNNNETYDEWLCLQKELSLISEKKAESVSGITINHHHHNQQQQLQHLHHPQHHQHHQHQQSQHSHNGSKFVDKQLSEIFDTNSKCVDNQLSEIFGSTATSPVEGTPTGTIITNDNINNRKAPQQQQHQQLVVNSIHLSDIFSAESITNKSVETRLEAMFGESPVEKSGPDLVETRLEELFSESPPNTGSSIHVVNTINPQQHYAMSSTADNGGNVSNNACNEGAGEKRQWTNNTDLLSPNASSSPITTYAKRSCMVNAYMEESHVTSHHPRWMIDQHFDFSTANSNGATNDDNVVVPNDIRKRSWNGDIITNSMEQVTNKKMCFNSNSSKTEADLEQDLLGLETTSSPEGITNEMMHHVIHQQQQHANANIVSGGRNLQNDGSATQIHENIAQQMQGNVLMHMQPVIHHQHQIQQHQHQHEQPHPHHHSHHSLQQQHHHHLHNHHQQQQQQHIQQSTNPLLGPPTPGSVFDNTLNISTGNANLSSGSSGGSMTSNFDEDINRHVQNAIDSILNLQNSESDSLNFSLDHSMGSFLADSPLDHQSVTGQHHLIGGGGGVSIGGTIVQTSSATSSHCIISSGKRRSLTGRIDELGDCLISGGSGIAGNLSGSAGDNSNMIMDSPSSVISTTATSSGGGNVSSTGVGIGIGLSAAASASGGIADFSCVTGIDDAVKSIMTS